MFNEVELFIFNIEDLLNSCSYILFPLIFGLVFFIGLILVVYSFIDEIKYNNRIINDILVIGKIIDKKTYSDRDTDTYAAIIQYEINGMSYIYESEFSSTSHPKIGENIDLLCNPLNFNNVIEKDLKTFMISRIVGAIFTIFSLIFILSFTFVYFQQDCHNLKELFYYIQNNN